MVRRSRSSEKLLARSGVWPGPGPEPGEGAAVAVGSLVWSDMSDALVRRCGGEAEAAAAPTRDQLDDLGDAAVLRLDLGGDAAEVERHDAVGDLQDVVHVVADEDDAE